MRMILMFLTVLVVAAVAFATSLSSAVQQLDSDCAARIAAIGTPSTAKLKKEAKGLARVRPQLAKYTGGNSVKDFRTIAKAGPLLLASGTQDPAILTDVQTILGCFEDGVNNRLNSAQSILDELLDPPHVAFIKGQMALARQYFNAGKAALPTNPVVAAAWFIKAYDLFGFNIARARNLLNKEQGTPPPAGISVSSSQSSLGIVNASAVDYDISKIRVFASVESGMTTVKTYTGQSAKSLVAGFLAAKGSNHIAAGTTFDLFNSFLTPLATAAGAPGGRVHGRLWVFLKGEKFFVVDFDVTTP